MAIFYSPGKVQQARDKVAEKEAAVQRLREEKNEEKERKMQGKAEKRRQIEERKRLRATAREMKLDEQAKRRQEREDDRMTRAANNQLQIDHHREQDTRNAILPPVIANAQDNSILSQVEVQEVEHRVTGRGRRVQLPQRFRA